MNKWTWLIVGAAVLWALISWNWYVCGIKNLCTVNEAGQEITERIENTFTNTDLENEPVDERPDERVVGGEVVASTVVSTSTREVGERTIVRCDAYLTGSVNPNASNAPADVLKVEQFLNNREGESLEENGTYEQADVDAVNRFQSKYASVILDPLGLTAPTGRVLGSTRDHINRLECALSARN